MKQILLRLPLWSSFYLNSTLQISRVGIQHRRHWYSHCVVVLALLHHLCFLCLFVLQGRIWLILLSFHLVELVLRFLSSTKGELLLSFCHELTLGLRPGHWTTQDRVHRLTELLLISLNRSVCVDTSGSSLVLEVFTNPVASGLSSRKAFHIVSLRWRELKRLLVLPLDTLDLGVCKQVLL